MFEHEVDNAVQDFGYQIQSQGLDLQTYLAYTGMTEEALRDSFRERAENQVKVRLALEKIAELEKFDVTDEDVDAQYNKLAEQYEMDVETIKSILPAEDIKKDVSTTKALDIVKENATITEVDANEFIAESVAEKIEEAGEKAEEKKPERKPEPRAQKKPEEKPAEAAETAAEEAPKAEIRNLEKPEITMIPAESLEAESPAGIAKEFLAELTKLMGVEVSIDMGTDAEGNVYGFMQGDTLGILIGRRGETLDALQYLTSLKVNRGKDSYTRVTLDTENYREKREDTLIRLANRMANRALRTGRRVSLEPMNPYERRVIHYALQKNGKVDTHSEGDEPSRHVVITLKK
jgi:spoIIIJ-associated protein